MQEYFILLVFGTFTGITSSLFGFGGGFIIVPLIYHLQKGNPYAMQIAVATSICIMIVNSLNAIHRHHKAGNILWSRVTPLAYYITAGSFIGVIAAVHLPGIIVRYAFISYMLYVIVNCLISKDFLIQNNKEQYLSSRNQKIYGVAIGSISSILGVGGSVLTVPLMRRLGLKMKQAVALANPLSLPVAIVGSILYVFMGMQKHIYFGADYLGYIYLPGVFILSVCGFIGIPIGTQLAGTISDRLHAKVYIGLLIVALLSMLLT